MEKLIFTFLSLLTFKLMLPGDTGSKVYMQQPAQQEQTDGPYVQYKNDQIVVSYIQENNGIKEIKKESIELQQKKSLSLKVMTDLPGISFRVQLKEELQNERSEYPAVKKLLVLSDIEGNFTAFRNLLQANNIIDDDFNWKFGDGHLVLTGDFFDRGNQVTEVLWLIYYLEEKAKAKAASGYVHFILGNHEIMNLSGDLRYLPKKYQDNAALLHQQYTTLYNENSELGRWLRTKNVVEKIGNLLFAHGGISAYINKMNISIPEINTLARPYYADSSFKYSDQRSDIIMGDMGPLWFRGYYSNVDPNISSQLDSTLSLYNADHIITGHTIVADTISVLYNGRLLNTDVHHAEGKSEALLIEDDKYYRVNSEGRKVLLMEVIKRNN
jgi:hypothetical protein